MLARRFPGTGQLSVGPVWVAPSQLTVMARVFCTTTAGGTLFGRWEGSPNNSFLLGTEGFAIVDTTSTYRTPTATRVAARGRWCTVFGVVDATTMAYYVDGVLSASSAQTGGPINLGTTYRSGSRPEGDQLTGSISDLAFWNVPLNRGEIDALTRGVRPGSVRAGSLIGWWPFDCLRGQTSERDVLEQHPMTLSAGVTVGEGPDLEPRVPMVLAAVIASSNITAPLISASTALYAPQLIPGAPAFAPFISATTALYTPTVLKSIPAVLIDSTVTLYTPTVRRSSIAVTETISDTHVFTAYIARPLVNVSPPAISGTASEGSQLEASPGVWSGTEPITFAYQWRRCDAGGAACVDITGETGISYIVRAADVGGTLRIRVTAENG